MEHDKRAVALELFQEAFSMQQEGELDVAVGLYKRSIDLCPTAEAYTSLGGTYRFQGKLDDAIAACKAASEIDPGFGNPYNDIGTCLIEQGYFDEAVPWLESAIASERYDSYHHPWYNLGRSYVGLELYNKARLCFNRALDLEPNYDLARDGLLKLRMLLQ
ncbi:MAG: tetratricopeptide repeat protein [Bryobacteraceae bacterium]